MKNVMVCIDVQKDFMYKNSALPVLEAESIIPNLKILTEIARKNNVKVINTMDFHRKEDVELSDNPDMINTFPPHCLIDNPGHNFIPEVEPEKFPYIVNYQKGFVLKKKEINSNRNIVIAKNKTNVFTNIHTEKVLEYINPERVFVYGVAANVCVNFAALGLAKKYETYIILDAIKELPIKEGPLSMPLIKNCWINAGIKLIDTKNILRYIYNG